MLEGRLDTSQAGPVILVVDDDPQVRDLAVMMLEDTGFSVIEAGSGEEALDSLRHHPDVRLLFTDIRMPVMDGHEAIRRIRVHKRRGDKVILVTGALDVLDESLQQLGDELIDRIGVDNVMWSSDYPHSESTFGFTRNAIKSVVDAVGPQAAPAILGGNVMRFLGLD